jgi:alkaline phosphatase
MPYTTLSYAGGPGFNSIFNPDGSRINPLTFNYSDYKLQYPTLVPLENGLHGGQDVGVWASGPQSHLFSGHYEQNSIPLLMAYVLKVGPYAEDEKCEALMKIPSIYFIFVFSIVSLINF